jgi:hypothetical protein
MYEIMLQPGRPQMTICYVQCKVTNGGKNRKLCGVTRERESHEDVRKNLFVSGRERKKTTFLGFHSLFFRPFAKTGAKMSLERREINLNYSQKLNSYTFFMTKPNH